MDLLVEPLITNLPLVLVLGSNVVLAGAFFIFFRRFKATVRKHEDELDKREKELRHRVLELSVLRSLGERVGYSLDIREILEVITGSLGGLINFSTVSYMLPESEGKILFKSQIVQPVSSYFVHQVKEQMLEALSLMLKKELQATLIEETATGTNLDEHLRSSVGSYFNLPVAIGGQVVALINVSSPLPGLYGGEETTVLYTILEQVNSQATKLAQVVENEKRRLSAMVASLEDGVLMVDLDFRLLVVNKAVANLLIFNNTASNNRELNLLDVLGAVSPHIDLQGAIHQALSTQTVVRLPEFEREGKVLQIDVEPVKDRFGYLLGAAVVFRDKTEERSLARMKEEFTAMMVHELRTPLTTIKYSVAGLSMKPDVSQEELQTSLKIMSATTNNMLSLVSDLLDVARMEAGKFEVVEKADDLKSLVEEKVEVFKSMAEQKGLQLMAEVDPSLSHLNFDRRRLSQALDNLLSNALKYTEKGMVGLKAKVMNNQALVSVSDTGEGIAPEDKPKLFSKFGLLGKGKTGEKIGTGLGLIITKGIIEAHGGKIWVDSTGPGQGTTFSFTLPLSLSA